MKYKRVELKDVCSLSQGLQIPISKRFREDGPNRYFYITVQFLKDNSDKYFIENPPERVKCSSDDILVVRTGNTGQIITGVDGCFHNNFFKVEPNEKIYPKFLYYTLKSPELYTRMRNVASGTTILDLKHSAFLGLDIYLPDFDNQVKIAYVLDIIDQKIKVCESINNNLEKQILRIFDSWFVKFELSEELTDSRLGLIPKDWEIDYLGSKKSCSIIGSGIDDFDGFKIYIATADVDKSTITNNETLITMDDKPSRANMQPIKKSIWFAKMIDSRKLIMVDEYCNDLLNNYIFSTGFCGLKCVDKYFYYLWTFLLSKSFNTIKNNFCTGTTMQAINNKDTKLIEFVLPEDNILSKFNSIAEPMFKAIYYNNIEIKKLEKLKDILLPKLLSGEIDVSNINCD